MNLELYKFLPSWLRKWVNVFFSPDTITHHCLTHYRKEHDEHQNHEEIVYFAVFPILIDG